MVVTPSHLPSVLLLDVESLLAVALPLLVELAVFARGVYTREPTDLVLAAVAVPCLLVSILAGAEALNPSGGVYWGSLFSLAAGGLLTFLVVTDAVAAVVVRTRAAE